MNRYFFPVLMACLLACSVVRAADVDPTVPDDVQRKLRKDAENAADLDKRKNAADQRKEQGEAETERVKLLVQANRVRALVQPEINNDDWQAAVRKNLEKNVSFEFADTPLTDAFQFMNKFAGLNLIIDPGVLERAGPVTLKVQDMPMHNALNWLCKFANARFEITDHAVHILGNGPQPANDAAARQIAPNAHLRVKLPNGAEIETDGGVLNEVPELLQLVLGQIGDTTKDGVLVYRIGDMAQTTLVEKSRDVLTKLAPAVTVTLNPELKLLVVTGDDPIQLRRAGAVLNALLVPPKAPSRGDRQDPRQFPNPDQIRDETMRRMGAKGPDPFNNPGQPDPRLQRKMKPGVAPDEKKPDTVKDNF